MIQVVTAMIRRSQRTSSTFGQICNDSYVSLLLVLAYSTSAVAEGEGGSNSNDENKRQGSSSIQLPAFPLKKIHQGSC